MLWAAIWSVARHHGEPADPDLVRWIKNLIDSLVDLGPWTIVIGLGLLILMIPVAISAVYLMQQRRKSAVDRASAEREER